MNTTLQIGNRVELRTNYTGKRWGGKDFTIIRHGEVVELGDPTNPKYAGRVRIRWTDVTGSDGIKTPERKIIRTWYNPANLLVV